MLKWWAVVHELDKDGTKERKKLMTGVQVKDKLTGGYQESNTETTPRRTGDLFCSPVRPWSRAWHIVNGKYWYLLNE